MKLVVLTDDILLNELKSGLPAENISFVQVNTVDELASHTDADAYFDLLFQKEDKRTQKLVSLLPKPVFINSVNYTLAETNSSFIRINGWPTFLKRKIIEASCSDEAMKEKASFVSSTLNRMFDWVPDVPGFISARVVSMIINEAYFALEENVSSKNEIDIAMKLGTNYPYGPFEWSEKIGLEKIYSLLNELNKINNHYQPCSLLQKEATQ
jgi:3-hydroxybutyryl-CoA dehydrogenase